MSAASLRRRISPSRVFWEEQRQFISLSLLAKSPFVPRCHGEKGIPCAACLCRGFLRRPSHRGRKKCPVLTG